MLHGPPRRDCSLANTHGPAQPSACSRTGPGLGWTALAQNVGSAAAAADAQPVAMPETPVVATPEPSTLPHRRRLLRQLLGLPLAGLAAATGTASAAGLPDVPPGPGSSSAKAHLQDSAAAHGLAAWRGLRDVNASFDRIWSPASGWRAVGAEAVQLRLLPAVGLAALRQGTDQGQQYSRHSPGLTGPSTGTAGSQAEATVAPLTDPGLTAAAALDTAGLRLLLLGPLAVLDQTTAVHWAEPDTLDGRRCDQLLLSLSPGLGLMASSRMALFIDRDVGLLRRLRLAADGSLGNWRGQVEVDCLDYFRLQGVVWPRRFESPARWPLPGAPAQTAWLTGLDLDRGYGAEALQDDRWTGDAAAPARALHQLEPGQQLS